jgi:hypothetical protein
MQQHDDEATTNNDNCNKKKKHHQKGFGWVHNTYLPSVAHDKITTVKANVANIFFIFLALFNGMSSSSSYSSSSSPALFLLALLY